MLRVVGGDVIRVGMRDMDGEGPALVPKGGGVSKTLLLNLGSGIRVFAEPVTPVGDLMSLSLLLVVELERSNGAGSADDVLAPYDLPSTGVLFLTGDRMGVAGVCT